MNMKISSFFEKKFEKKTIKDNRRQIAQD